MTPDRTRLASPYGIHKLPLRHTGTDGPSNVAAALVLIVDPEHQPERRGTTATPEGLTNTEARIVGGADLKHIIGLEVMR